MLLCLVDKLYGEIPRKWHELASSFLKRSCADQFRVDDYLKNLKKDRNNTNRDIMKK